MSCITVTSSFQVMENGWDVDKFEWPEYETLNLIVYSFCPFSNLSRNMVIVPLQLEHKITCFEVHHIVELVANCL